MTTKKFLTSVADVIAYDSDDNIVFTAKTLLDSSMEVTLANAEVRGGRGNKLLYQYYHTGALNITLTDTQFNLAMLGATVGKSIVTGNNVYTEEDVTLGASGAGTVTGTPLALPDSGLIYGWVSLVDGTTERVTFTGSNFTCSGSQDDVVCVRYYALDSASRSVEIPANAIPSVVRLVMEAQLNSSDVATNKIGIVQMIIPKLILSGAFTISMTSDGVSNTPLTGMALAYSNSATAACTTEEVYAEVIEILDSTNWYDDVIALAIEGGDFALTDPATDTLVVYAIKNNGDAPFVPPYADLTFSSDTPATATIGANTGVVTTVAAGTTLLSVYITSKSSIEASCTLTVS